MHPSGGSLRKNYMPGLNENEENMKDLITVIVPCYNVEKYIARCIQSIENQTYGFENIELILIDDASTDNTAALLDAYRQKYPQRVIVISLKKNGKQGAARNKGLDIASGKYVTFVDSDDMIDTTMLEKMHTKIIEHDCDEVRCGMHRFSRMQDIENRYIGSNDRYMDLTDDEQRKEYILSSMSCVVPSRLFKREVLEKNHIRFMEGVSYEDAHFSGICCFYISSRYWLDEELYYYYQNDSSTMGTYNSQKNMDHILVANGLFQELKERGIYDEVMKHFYHETNAYYFWMIFLNPMMLIFGEKNREAKIYKDELLKVCPDIFENAYFKGIKNYDYLKAIEYLK